MEKLKVVIFRLNASTRMSNHARDWPEPSRNNQSRSTTAVVPKRDAIYNAQVRRGLLRFFNIPLKNIFKISSNFTANCCVSPPGPANYICSPQDAATLKRLGNTAKGWEALQKVGKHCKRLGSTAPQENAYFVAGFDSASP